MCFVRFRMDSFVLAETFKYLYLLFADPADLVVDLDEFLFTTEAHLLPLSLARNSNYTVVTVSYAPYLRSILIPFWCRGHGRVELYLYPPSGPHWDCNGKTLPLFTPYTRQSPFIVLNLRKSLYTEHA